MLEKTAQKNCGFAQPDRVTDAAASVLNNPAGLANLSGQSMSPSYFSSFQIRAPKWRLPRVPGDAPSMEGIQQQQDGADTDNTAQNERVSPLPKVDSLDQAVHSRKTIGQSIHFALN